MQLDFSENYSTVFIDFVYQIIIQNRIIYQTTEHIERLQCHLNWISGCHLQFTTPGNDDVGEGQLFHLGVRNGRHPVPRTAPTPGGRGLTRTFKKNIRRSLLSNGECHSLWGRFISTCRCPNNSRRNGRGCWCHKKSLCSWRLRARLECLFCWHDGGKQASEETEGLRLRINCYWLKRDSSNRSV